MRGYLPIPNDMVMVEERKKREERKGSREQSPLLKVLIYR